MAEVHVFTFTPKGGAPRVQQVHVADLALKRGEDGGQRLSAWISTTRPGETLDDRGVEGWDSEVLVALLTDPLPMPTRRGERIEVPNVFATEKWGERFLYYWEHEGFVTARMTATNAGDQWQITFDGICKAGNRVSFEASLPVTAA